MRFALLIPVVAVIAWLVPGNSPPAFVQTVAVASLNGGPSQVMAGLTADGTLWVFNGVTSTWSIAEPTTPQTLTLTP